MTNRLQTGTNAEGALVRVLVLARRRMFQKILTSLKPV